MLKCGNCGSTEFSSGNMLPCCPPMYEYICSKCGKTTISNSIHYEYENIKMTALDPYSKINKKENKKIKDIRYIRIKDNIIDLNKVANICIRGPFGPFGKGVDKYYYLRFNYEHNDDSFDIKYYNIEEARDILYKLEKELNVLNLQGDV